MTRLLCLSCVVAFALVAGCHSNEASKASAVTLRGTPVTLEGKVPQAGREAPDFAVVANDISPWEFSKRAPGVYILASVPSLDTPVCSTETQRFNQEAAKLGKDVKVVVVSMDLPFAQKRWCGAEGVSNVQTVSDYRDRDFAEAYGLRIRENGLLARAVFVIDRAGRITYTQVVPEVTKEPDYDAVLAAAKKAAGQ